MTPRVVDALGTLCPVPVRMLARAARGADPGQVIELLADDPLVRVDVPAWCHTHGHGVEIGPDPLGGWRLVVTVADAPGG